MNTSSKTIAMAGFVLLLLGILALGYYLFFYSSSKLNHRLEPVAEQAEQIDQETIPEEPHPTPSQTVTAGSFQEPLPLKEEVLLFIQKWIIAWEKTAGEGADLQPYFDCYAEAFSPQGQTKAAWQTDKIAKAHAKEWIKVGLESIKIGTPGDTKLVNVEFVQDYQSSNYSEKTPKLLVLQKTDAVWRIVKEQSIGSGAESPMAFTGCDPKTQYPFSVFLGSFQSKHDAQELIDQYRDSGLRPYWVRVDLGSKGVWYRVFDGYFSDQQAAASHQNKHGLKTAVIRKTPYALLLGKFSTEAELFQQQEALIAQGWSSYTIPQDAETTCLFVGGYSTKTGAAKNHEMFEDAGIQNQFVLR